MCLIWLCDSLKGSVFCQAMGSLYTCGLQLFKYFKTVALKYLWLMNSQHDTAENLSHEPSLFHFTLFPEGLAPLWAYMLCLKTVKSQ